MESKILITIKNQYGNNVVVPCCPTAKRLAKLAGTKTLTLQSLHTISDLGYQIKYAPSSAKLAHFQPVEVSLKDLADLVTQ